MDSFVAFGMSEILSDALRNKLIDAAVIAADGCGTAVVTDPNIVQGLGGRISRVVYTEPIKKVINAIGSANVINPLTAEINSVEGTKNAFLMGHKTVAVTTPSIKDAKTIRNIYGNKVIILGIHTTGMSKEDSILAFDIFDIVTACASKYIREECYKRSGILIAGNKVPVYAITDIGKNMVKLRLNGLGMRSCGLSDKQYPPRPLI